MRFPGLVECVEATLFPEDAYAVDPPLEPAVVVHDRGTIRAVPPARHGPDRREGSHQGRAVESVELTVTSPLLGVP